MIWLTTAALAHDVLPERIDDPLTWPLEAGWRASPPVDGGGTRVAALVDLPGGLPQLEARGRTGDEVGPWVPLVETFRLDAQHVAVADLDRTWDEAELRIADDGRRAIVRWELLTPRFPDAGRVARQAVPPLPQPLPAELVTLGVIGRAAWGARPTGCSATEDDWYRMAIHHTAGNQTSSGTVQGAVQALQAYAQDSGAYCDTPYQFLVGHDGSLWEGRALHLASGATGGGNNDGNIAVCFLGCYHPSGCPNGAGDPATDAMIDAGQLLVQTLTALHGIPSDADSIRGHQDWPGNATACPGDYVVAELDTLRTDLAWFAAEEVARSHPAGAPIPLSPGEAVEVWVDLQNTGGLVWEPGTTNLGTTDPRDAASALWDTTWLSENRPTTVDAEVAPGEVGRFAFTVVGGEPGTSHASFGLVHEGVTWFADAPWGGGPGDDLLTLDVVVEVSDEPPVGTTETTPGTDEDATSQGDADIAQGFAPAPYQRVAPSTGCGCASGPGSFGGLAVLLALLPAVLRRRGPAALLLVPSAAAAQDGTWTDLHPGVRYTEELVGGPIRRFLVDIDTCAPGVRLRATSPLDGTASRTTSNLALSLGAAVAINGDFYDHDFGMNLGEGVDWAPYLNGLSDGRDRSTSGNLAIGADRIELFPDHLVFAGPEPWMEQVVSGRWTLIEAGHRNYGIADGGFVCSPGLRHPRTVVGRSGDGRHVYLMVVDGRGFGGSIGMTCDEVIDRMAALGATDVMGLDGGGSSTMFVDALGGVVNHPSDGDERRVLNHLAVFADGVGAAPHCGELAAAPVAADPVGPLAPVGAPGWFAPVTPIRLFDTRADASALIGASLDADGRVLANTSFGFVPDLPGDTVGVWANLTTTGSAAAGFVTVYPGGSALPDASSLNHAAGESVGSATVVGLGTGGLGMSMFTFATTHLVLDLQGTFGPDGAGLVPLAPERLLDTRATGRLSAFTPTVIVDPLPAPTVAASLNVTVVDPAAAGFLTVYPCDAPVPDASNVNFDAGEAVAGAVSVGSEAGVCALASVDLDLVVDRTGTWDDGAGLAVQAVTPLRVLDTRSGTGGWQGRVKPGQVVPLSLSSITGWPADAQAAILRLTVTEPSSPGFLTAYPCAEAVPEASSLNYAPGATVGNLVTARLAEDGQVCVYASAATHLVVDLTGVGVVEPHPEVPDTEDPVEDIVEDGGEDPEVPEGRDEDPEVPATCRTGPAGGGALGGVFAVWLLGRRRQP